MTYTNSSLDPETALHPAHRRPTTVLTKLNDNLYVGGVLNGIPLPVKIKHVISFYPTEMYALGHPVRSMLFLPFNDGLVLPPTELLVGTARWINTCRADAPTLVACQGGLNRSPLLVALALVLEGTGVSEAIEGIRATRSPDVLSNPVFEAWLMDNAEALRS